MDPPRVVSPLSNQHRQLLPLAVAGGRLAAMALRIVSAAGVRRRENVLFCSVRARASRWRRARGGARRAARAGGRRPRRSRRRRPRRSARRRARARPASAAHLRGTARAQLHPRGPARPRSGSAARRALRIFRASYGHLDVPPLWVEVGALGAVADRRHARGSGTSSSRCARRHQLRAIGPRRREPAAAPAARRARAAVGSCRPRRPHGRRPLVARRRCCAARRAGVASARSRARDLGSLGGSFFPGASPAASAVSSRRTRRRGARRRGSGGARARRARRRRRARARAARGAAAEARRRPRRRSPGCGGRDERGRSMLARSSAARRTVATVERIGTAAAGQIGADSGLAGARGRGRLRPPLLSPSRRGVRVAAHVVGVDPRPASRGRPRWGFADDDARDSCRRRRGRARRGRGRARVRATRPRARFMKGARRAAFEAAAARARARASGARRGVGAGRDPRAAAADRRAHRRAGPRRARARRAAAARRSTPGRVAARKARGGLRTRAARRRAARDEEEERRGRRARADGHPRRRRRRAAAARRLRDAPGDGAPRAPAVAPPAAARASALERQLDRMPVITTGVDAESLARDRSSRSARPRQRERRAHDERGDHVPQGQEVPPLRRLAARRPRQGRGIAETSTTRPLYVAPLIRSYYCCVVTGTSVTHYRPHLPLVELIRRLDSCSRLVPSRGRRRCRGRAERKRTGRVRARSAPGDVARARLGPRSEASSRCAREVARELEQFSLHEHGTASAARRRVCVTARGLVRTARAEMRGAAPRRAGAREYPRARVQTKKIRARAESASALSVGAARFFVF